MSKKWFNLLKGIIFALAAGVVFVIALAFFVAWIAWRNGVPLPT